MKRNFYLQHSLMAMNDPRMRGLVDEEGLRGLGAYWIIIEKLALLPEPRAQLEYLRPFCTSKRISLAYLKKIILNYNLFIIEEDDYFSAQELNPVKRRAKKTEKNEVESADYEQENESKRKKTSRNNTENQPKKSVNYQNVSHTTKHVDNLVKENIKDNITSAAKEKETSAAADDKLPKVNKVVAASNDDSCTAGRISLTSCDDFGRPQPPLHPVRCWQELVDGLAEQSSWLDIACMQSGFGKLLMNHIDHAIAYFKQHIEVYDKGHDLLTLSDVRRYFANFVKAGQRTSQALYQSLLRLDAKQQASAPPDPYRFEQHVDGQRSYLGCPIPDDAPPRPDAHAFWNEALHLWISQNHT